MYDAYAPRQGLARVLHEVEYLRASKPVGTLYTITIHPHLDVGEETRCVLDLVDDDRRLEALEEELGLLHRESPLKRIVEGNIVPPLLGDVLKECRLAHLARSRDEKDREGLRNGKDGRLDGAWDIHGWLPLQFDQTKQ